MDAEAQVRTHLKLQERSDNQLERALRREALNLTLTAAGGQYILGDKLIAHAEAVYQWLRNGPAKTDGE